MESKTFEDAHGVYDLRVPFGGGLGLDEAISRAIRDCFLRNDGIIDKKKMDETIKGFGKKTPQYKSTWKEFKETFSIQEVDENYINQYAI